MKASPNRTVLFLDDGATTPTAVEISEALDPAVACAVAVSSPDERFPMSFTSLFLGLLGVQDATGTWLEGQFAKPGANLRPLLKRRCVTIETLRRLYRDPTQRDRFVGPVPRTSSAAAAMTEAQRRAHDL